MSTLGRTKSSSSRSRKERPESRSELGALNRSRSVTTRSGRSSSDSPFRNVGNENQPPLKAEAMPRPKKPRRMYGSEDGLAAAHMAWARGGANGHIK